VKPYCKKVESPVNTGGKVFAGRSRSEQILFRPGCANDFVRRDSASDALGLHEQQNDSADEHERSDGGRDEMIVSGRNVHSQKINGFSWSRKTQARIGEHDKSQNDQNDCSDGFYVHIEFVN
jgi:hypothetical protein